MITLQKKITGFDLQIKRNFSNSKTEVTPKEITSKLSLTSDFFPPSRIGNCHVF